MRIVITPGMLKREYIASVKNIKALYYTGTKGLSIDKSYDIIISDTLPVTVTMRVFYRYLDDNGTYFNRSYHTAL